MRIVIDARLYGLENAGLGRYLINLVSELERIDSETEYVLLLRKKYFNELELSGNWKKVLVDVKHYSFEEQLKLPKLIKNLIPDLVHFPHMNVPRFYKGKFVVTVHDLLMQKHRGSEATTLPFYSYFPKLIASKYIFSHAVKKAKKILVPSFAVKKEVNEFFKTGENKIEVTYEGVGDNFGRNSSEDILSKNNLKSDYFLYAGNAYPHKNLNRAIEAVINTNSQLVIVTSRNVFVEKLEEKIKNLRANDNVKVLGYVSDPELNSLYKNSLGFIYPSLSEGFGLPGLEAMKAGTLLLCSDIPVFNEVYKNIPFYFDPYSITSIEETINKVVAMTKIERNKKISAGKKFVTRYSWNKMAQQTLQVYKEALSL